MKAIHPGRILKREMSARGLSANKLALALRVLQSRYDLAVAEQNIGAKVSAEVEQAAV